MDKELQAKLALMLKMNRNNGISYLTSAECAYKLITQANKSAVIEAVRRLIVDDPWLQGQYAGNRAYSSAIKAIATALDTEVK